MKLTLDALEVLDAIDRHGSFAAAAEALHRVPSSITYTVQKLEDDLGFAVFRREGRRSRLTPAGQVLLEQGRKLLDTADRMLELAHLVNSGWEFGLTIVLDTVWNIDSFLPLVKDFQELNTGVRLTLKQEAMGGSLEAMREGRADIVLGGPPPVEPMTGIKFKQVLTAQWVYVAARDHPLTKAELPLKESDLIAYTSIVVADSSLKSPIAPHRLIENQLIIRVSCLQQKIQALIHSVGVGFLPVHKIQSYVDTGDLVILPLEKTTEETFHYCSWRVNNKGRAMRWFVNRILEDANIASGYDSKAAPYELLV